MLLGNGFFTTILKWLLNLDENVFGSGEEWKLGWANMPETWIIVLIIIPAVLGFAFLVYRFEPNLPNPYRILLGGLRVLAVLLILVMIFQPYLYRQITLKQESQVAVVVDTSKSMTFQDRYRDDNIINKLGRVTGLQDDGEENPGNLRSRLSNMSRLNILNRTLNNEELKLLEKMSKDQVLKEYQFATSLQNAPSEGDFTEAEESGGTALGDAINQTLKKQQGHQTSAIVIFTDGQSNIGADPRQAARKISQRGDDIPIYTVAVGNPYKPKDIVMTDLEAPDAAQADAPDPVVFKATIKSQGLRKEDSKSATAYLRTSSGETLKTKDITLKGNGEKQEEILKWTPKETGNYQVEVGVEPKPEEIQTKNNKISHNLRVVDREIRVFYIEGLPRYEYRFLKNAMIRDKTLKVQVLLQSADPTYPQPSSPGVEPASKFPQTRKELANYDVIILGDITPSQLKSVGATSEEEIMERIKAFVDELGGGVLFLTGPNHNPESFIDTPLEDLLPVVVGDTARSANRKNPQPFRPKLTPQGRDHPVMRLVSDPEKNVELWEDNRKNKESLPQPLRWYQPVEKAKLGAHTLAVHPKATRNGDPVPIVTVQRYGRGRTMFVGSDDIWYSMRKIIGDRYYYSFWSESVRWLRGGRLMGTKRYRIRVEKDEYNPGEKVQVYAQVLNRDYKPADRDEVTVHIEQKDLNREETVTLHKQDEPGNYKGTFRPRDLGDYRAWIGTYSTRQSSDDDVDDYDETSFKVVPLDVEGKNPEVNPDLLNKISRETNGEFRFLHNIVPPSGESEPKPLYDLLYRKPEKVSLRSDREQLWNAPLFLFLFVTILGIEWFLRKRTQLI